VSSEILQGTSFSELTLLEGEYDYVQNLGTILIDGDSYNYVGYAVVDSE